jgi:hypothetical protein
MKAHFFTLFLLTMFGICLGLRTRWQKALLRLPFTEGQQRFLRVVYWMLCVVLIAASACSLILWDENAEHWQPSGSLWPSAAIVGLLIVALVGVGFILVPLVIPKENANTNFYRMVCRIQLLLVLPLSLLLLCTLAIFIYTREHL